MESKTVQQLQDYCRENKIRGYSNLKKSELIELIQRYIVFQFDYDLFSKPKKERELKVKCCDQYYKQSYMKQHLQSKNHQEYENIFSFDKSLFGKPKKARPTQIKCNACGKYYKPAYKGHHLRSLTYGQGVDKAPKENKVPVVEPKKSNYQTLKNWILE
ncbi:rho_N domain-containing protein [Trichonephila clavipes]|nr:rho_N domain-containing protein [Trichonephila clavipes]